jgi:hypothetical protein
MQKAKARHHLIMHAAGRMRQALTNTAALRCGLLELGMSCLKADCKRTTMRQFRKKTARHTVVELQDQTIDRVKHVAKPRIATTPPLLH